MNRLYPLLVLVAVAMFAYAPVLIVRAPYESTMGLVQKIFYFHVPSWMVMFTAAFVCGIGSALFLFTEPAGGRPRRRRGGGADGVFGLIGLLTGPLWGRKAWGVWWQWDARLTSALVLWLIFVAYLLLRRTAGRARRSSRRRSRSSGWPTCRSSTGRSTSGARCIRRPPSSRRCSRACAGRSGGASAAFLLLFVLLLSARVRLETRRAELEALYLAVED